jgi:hypothetical protein
MPREKWKNPSGSKEYYAWRSMRQRCTNKQSAAWKNYGARGITVCDTWLESYDAFYTDMGPCPEGHTLERLDNSMGYAPDNCAWVDWTAQINNRRNTKVLVANGKAQPLSVWARELGLKPSTIHKRLERMGIERALSPENLNTVRSREFVHGTQYAYRQLKCRCTQCKAENARVAREYRKKRTAEDAPRTT